MLVDENLKQNRQQEPTKIDNQLKQNPFLSRQKLAIDHIPDASEFVDEVLILVDNQLHHIGEFIFTHLKWCQLFAVPELKHLL
jgi:hypothetical protein